ncbi:hypothetical protein ACK32R_04835 [Aeromonas dhakensis]|uniref:hypothetical protein n=1 Tax=Aeromonas dhakensis TaxID=196024 RepID=UPI00398880DB
MTMQRPGLTEEQASNSFSDEELEGMSYGNNPLANAYRELLAFRRLVGAHDAVHSQNGTLRDLRALAEQASEGEWEAVNNGVIFGVVRRKGSHDQIAACTMHDGHQQPVSPLEANSRFIAAAHPAVVLGLIERLEYLERLVEEQPL